jgi:hypothetical protein
VRWFCSITSCSGLIRSTARRNSDFLEGMLMTCVAESLIIAILREGNSGDWNIRCQIMRIIILLLLGTE